MFYKTCQKSVQKRPENAGLVILFNNLLMLAQIISIGYFLFILISV